MRSLIYYLVPFAVEKLDHQSTYSSIICCVVAFFIVFIVINVLNWRQDGLIKHYSLQLCGEFKKKSILSCF